MMQGGLSTNKTGLNTCTIKDNSVWNVICSAFLLVHNILTKNVSASLNTT